jgi:hypothetical protein
VARRACFNPAMPPFVADLAAPSSRNTIEELPDSFP